MADLINQSESIIREARASLDDQRAGGRRRKSIGRASARMKAGHFARKLRNLFIGLFAIVVGTSIIGSVIGGIGPMGVLAVVALAVVTALVLLRYPSLKVPDRASLNSPDVRQLVGRTELWLESQRPALPPPAAKLVGGIGVRLDELEALLVEVDQKHPTALQIHKLVGEDLPEMIEGYQRIPERMRYEERAGTTPTRQLEEGLKVIGREIDSINRQLAEGSLDDLAIRTRYLDYKYGDGAELPAPAKDQ
jgi:hypothetical protein